MLFNSFFKLSKNITEVTPGSYQAEVELLPEHPVYEGHFPDMPVVPGVCTIQMIKECVEMITCKSMEYISILNCKFTAVIIPSQTSSLDILLTLSAEEGNYLLKATVKTETQTFLSLKAKLK